MFFVMLASTAESNAAYRSNKLGAPSGSSTFVFFEMRLISVFLSSVNEMIFLCSIESIQLLTAVYKDLFYLLEEREKVWASL